MAEVIIRTLDLDRDAERLAAMWNESDSGWPNSWTHGQPMTQEMIRTWIRDADHVAIFVAEVDDEIVGYCSFSESRQGGEGYLALLNVNPRFHGRSIGRKLIQATIDHSVAKGWQRQTLGTWSANYKAVPTYKKTGHYWTPDSSVWMQCFIPGALQMPLAQPFFERHDWYSSYVRDIDQEPDDMRWEGVRVFTQRWEAEGKHLAIHIDQASRAPLAIETDEVLIAALPLDPKPLKGQDAQIELRLVSKRDQPLELFCHATGGNGLEVDHRERLTVPARDMVTRRITVRVTDEAPAKLDNGCAPSVRCLLMVDEVPVELFPGLSPKAPLSISSVPEQISLRPGQMACCDLVLGNAQPHPCSGKLYFVTEDGISVIPDQEHVSLPAEGWARVPLRIQAEAGVHTIHVRLEPEGDAGAKPVDETLVAMAARPGELAWHATPKQARIETDAIRVGISAKGGEIAIDRKDNGRSVTQLSPVLGPPYWPSPFRLATFELDVVPESTTLLVRLRGEPKGYEAVDYHLELRVTPVGLIAGRAWLQNRGGKSHTCTVGVGMGGDHDDQGRIAIPLADGVVYAPWEAVIKAWDDFPRHLDELHEPWLACERDGMVVGMAWSEQLTEAEAEWGVRLNSRAITLEPGQSTKPAEFALYAGHGDWRRARERLAPWFGSSQQPHPRVRNVLDARIGPAPSLTTSDVVEAPVVVDSAIMRPQDCEVDLSCQTLQVEPARLRIRDLNRRTPQQHSVRVTVPDQPGAYAGRCELRSVYQRSSERFSVVRVGTGDAVRIEPAEREGHPVWRVDNGLAALEIAPGFGPSLISWHQGDHGLLTSAFPTPRGFSWLYPWFGGLHLSVFAPEHRCWEGFLHREQHAAEPAEETDRSGLSWRGVRLTCHPEREDLRDIAVQVSFLTVGRSNVLKQVIRFTNHRPAIRKLIFSHSLAASLGGSLDEITLISEDVYREPSPWSVWAGEQRWAVAHNPHTDLAMAFVSTLPNIEINDQGRLGRTMGSMQEVTLGPEATVVYTLFAVACKGVQAAIAYTVLKDYAG